MMEASQLKKQLMGKRGDTPLHSVARAGNLAELKAIFFRTTGDVDLKELLEKPNQLGETALYIAAEYGYTDVVEEMIKYYDFLSVGIKASNGYDSFHIAAKRGNLEMVKILLKAIPRLYITVDESNTTPLHTAATRGHVEVVNYLLDQNRYLAEIAKFNGKNALHSATKNGHLEVVTALLNKQPGLATRTDEKGQTALHIAVKGWNIELVDELIKSNPSLINMVDSKGNKPLNIASMRGRKKIVEKLLLEHEETHMEAVNKSMETPLDAVKKTGHSEVAQLQQHGGQRIKSIAKNLKEMHAEGLNNAINSTTVVAVFIATVAFAAIFQVPGQFAYDPNNIPRGQANIAPQVPFVIFLIFDSVAVFISLAIVVVQTSIPYIDNKAKKQILPVVNKLMWLDCLLLSVAFLALTFVIVGKHDRWLAIAVTIIGKTIMASTMGAVSLVGDGPN